MNACPVGLFVCAVFVLQPGTGQTEVAGWICFIVGRFLHQCWRLPMKTGVKPGLAPQVLRYGKMRDGH